MCVCTKESVETLAAQALSAVVPEAERKSIVLSVEIPEGLTALLDMRWTAEALGALLDNRVKYAPLRLNGMRHTSG